MRAALWKVEQIMKISFHFIKCFPEYTETSCLEQYLKYILAQSSIDC